MEPFDVEILLTHAPGGVALVGSGSSAALREVTVLARVGTGAAMLILPDALRHRLRLPTLDTQVVTITDGTVAHYEVVGPVTLHCVGRTVTCRALALPGDLPVQLGSQPLAAMGLSADVISRRVVLDPDDAGPPRTSTGSAAVLDAATS